MAISLLPRCVSPPATSAAAATTAAGADVRSTRPSTATRASSGVPMATESRAWPNMSSCSSHGGSARPSEDGPCLGEHAGGPAELAAPAEQARPHEGGRDRGDGIVAVVADRVGGAEVPPRHGRVPSFGRHPGEGHGGREGRARRRATTWFRVFERLARNVGGVPQPAEVDVGHGELLHAGESRAVATRHRSGPDAPRTASGSPRPARPSRSGTLPCSRSMSARSSGWAATRSGAACAISASAASAAASASGAPCRWFAATAPSSAAASRNGTVCGDVLPSTTPSTRARCFAPSSGSSPANRSAAITAAGSGPSMSAGMSRNNRPSRSVSPPATRRPTPRSLTTRAEACSQSPASTAWRIASDVRPCATNHAAASRCSRGGSVGSS